MIVDARMKRIVALAILLALARTALAAPMRPATPLSDVSLDATAEAVIQRLPTCEVPIRTRVAEWKASASIACKQSAPNDAGCVPAQLRLRAEQLRRLRSCKFL